MSGNAVEQLRQAEAYKEEGNRWFQDGAYKKALGAYHKVFCYVNGLQVPGSDRTETTSEASAADATANRNRLPKEHVEELRTLKQSTRLNMAACYLKVGEHQKCVDACTAALTFGENSKAHFRRGQAHAELRNFSGAKSDLERAQELAPDDKSVAAEIRKVKASFAKADEEERERCAKMLGTTAKDEPQVSDAGYSQGRGSQGHEVHGNGDSSADHMQSHGSDHSHVHGHGRASRAAAAADQTASASSSSGTVVQPASSEVLDEARKPDFAVRELTYAWQQSEDDIRIYIPFDQNDDLSSGVDESRVQVEFGEWSILLVITGGAQGKPPWGLRLGDFHRRIAPDKCTCKLRSSRISLRLVKQSKGRWWNLLQRAPLHND